MCHTEQSDYSGWQITIRCTRRTGAEPEFRAEAFTAMAQAELQSSEDPTNWVDSRMQVISTGNRSFKTGAGCVRVLLAEVKEVIDALRR